MRRDFTMNRTGSLIALIAALLLLSAPASRAATPPSGSVSEAQPTFTWQGTFKPPIAAVGCSGPNDSNCDNFRLTVAAPSFPYQVDITLHVAAADDWDLRVYDAAG